MAGKPGRSGGARPNTGPKPKSERFKTAIQRTEKRIADRLPDIADSMLDLALGVTVEEVGLDGEKRVYTRPPDYRAGSYLMDRMMGKPMQSSEVDVTSNGETINTGLEGALLNIYGTSNRAPAAEDDAGS